MDWWNDLVEAGENFVDNASDVIGDAGEVITDAVTTVTDALTDAGLAVGNAAQDAGEWIGNAAQDAGEWIGDAARDVGQSIVRGAEGAVDLAMGAGEAVVDFHETLAGIAVDGRPLSDLSDWYEEHDDELLYDPVEWSTTGLVDIEQTEGTNWNVGFDIGFAEADMNIGTGGFSAEGEVDIEVLEGGFTVGRGEGFSAHADLGAPWLPSPGFSGHLQFGDGEFSTGVATHGGGMGDSQTTVGIGLNRDPDGTWDVGYQPPADDAVEDLPRYELPDYDNPFDQQPDADFPDLEMPIRGGGRPGGTQTPDDTKPDEAKPDEPKPDEAKPDSQDGVDPLRGPRDVLHPDLDPFDVVKPGPAVDPRDVLPEPDEVMPDEVAAADVKPGGDTAPGTVPDLGDLDLVIPPINMPEVPAADAPIADGAATDDVLVPPMDDVADVVLPPVDEVPPVEAPVDEVPLTDDPIVDIPESDVPMSDDPIVDIPEDAAAPAPDTEIDTYEPTEPESDFAQAIEASEDAADAASAVWDDIGD